mmetsp:Transcript_33629/g.68162  ORF Transcript_33629/g.68162 Transcript_33629/m.68162 type:complete len:270 (-) Transcript_33629:75-884(-)
MLSSTTFQHVSDRLQWLHANKLMITLEGKALAACTVRADFVCAKDVKVRNENFDLLSGEVKHKLSNARVLAKALLQAMHPPLHLIETVNLAATVHANELSILLTLVPSHIERRVAEVCRGLQNLELGSKMGAGKQVNGADTKGVSTEVNGAGVKGVSAEITLDALCELVDSKLRPHVFVVASVLQVQPEPQPKDANNVTLPQDSIISGYRILGKCRLVLLGGDQTVSLLTLKEIDEQLRGWFQLRSVLEILRTNPVVRGRVRIVQSKDD